MEYNYTTSQVPDKGVQVGPEPTPTLNAILAMTQGIGVQVGPEPIPTPNATLAMARDTNPGFAGNFVEVDIITDANNSAVYKSKAYPANVDGKQRPGAVVEYNSEFSVVTSFGGYINVLPDGYLAAEFLEFGSKDKYVEVTTPRTPVGARVEVKAYERFYRLDVGSDEIGNGSHANYFFWGISNKKWYIGCGTYGITNYAADTNWHNMRMVYDAEDSGCWVDELKVRDCVYSSAVQILKNFTLGRTTPTVNSLTYIAYSCVKKCALWVNGEQWRDVYAAIDPLGKPCMYDIVKKEAFYNGTTTALTVGLTLPQARSLGKHLPEGGGTLTVSLPSNWQEDEGVLNAKAEAEAKGWQIPVQTYEVEASAAATFALRRIWVRKTPNEYGSYVDTDGNHWSVDWCVDVWGADPQELGYEPYRSVETAIEYWGLTPWIDPEQEEEFIQEL